MKSMQIRASKYTCLICDKVSFGDELLRDPISSILSCPTCHSDDLFEGDLEDF